MPAAMSTITTVGVDADDTLWHCESLFRLSHARFLELLSEHGDPEKIEAQLTAVEKRNLRVYGYGAKGFTLSMIETALEVTDGLVDTRVIREILAVGREMLTEPIEPLPGVENALSALSDRYRLILITKGDLLHQEQKLASSGLGDYFVAVEIVSEKDADTYRRVFDRYGTGAEQAVMAGNSMRSDVLPALDAGCWGALIPYPLVWSHEAADAPLGHPRYVELGSISELPAWVDGVSKSLSL
ncbi:hydrolase, haloacid dehalogenase-like family [Caulobacter vibrioides CB15]|uniref:Hydrolase, haloacid dehalogenase-like family n=2 Tax=Caulobacter vibrioides TaxID=155892 RepID=Q9A4L4_CAUVC|nr:hydrolase, haloacid dehalogenase-like family [Caulobacter vibrioides CB15]ATC29651.1 HAD family hydrolase [Caulobacter vibrioides]